MFFKPQIKLYLTNLLRLSKQNEFYINILLFSTLLLPIALVSGPLILEISIFFIFLGYLYYFFTEKNKIKFNKLDILIFCFFLFLIFSSLLSEYKLISLKSSFFSIRFIIYIYAIFFLLNKLNYFFKYFFILSTLCLMFVVLDGYIQFFLGKDIFLIKRGGAMGQGYIITGVFGDEKKLGSFLIRFSPLVIGSYLIFSKQKKEKKANYLLFFCFLIFGLIFLTSERIAILYFLITIFFLIVYFLKNKINMSKIYIFLYLLLMIPSFIFSFGINQFNQTVENTYKQILPKGKFVFFSKQHQNFALTSIELFKKEKIIGIGPNNYRRLCSKINLDKVIKTNQKNYSNCSTHPHNIFFQLLSETGFIGIIFYLILFILLIKEVIKFLINKNINNPKIFFILPIIYYLNPLLPSGNFFNNWYMFIGIMGLPFYLFLSKSKKSV